MADPASSSRKEPEQTRPRAATRAAPEARETPRQELLPLHRSAGNRAVTNLVQRLQVQRNGPPSNIAKLDELLDRWNTPENEVIDLLGAMSGPEKDTVIAGYRDRLAGCLNFNEMKRAVTNLGAKLPVKLDWLQKAAIFGTTFITYPEIQKLVTDAPQLERDMLKNNRWKSYFLSVCTNDTIIGAVKDLQFDLVTQLTWVKGEASALFSLNLDKLRPLLSGRPAAELATISGDDWLPFWSDVCTNKTMEELVSILFPTDLVKQLRYMAAEGSDADLVKKRIAAIPAPQRPAVYTSNEAVELIRGFAVNEQAAIVQLLGGTPLQQVTLLGPSFPITKLTWATPSQDWVDALKTVRTDPLDVFRVAGADTAWAPFIRPRLAELFRGKSATVFGTDMVNLIWAAYGDGSAFNSADTLVVFRAIFGRDVTAPGDVIFDTGLTTRDRYNAVSPDDDAARELMRMVKTIPRSQVAAAPIAFCDTGWHETWGLLSGWTGPAMTDFRTSFFWMGKIIIKASSTGQMQSNQVATAGGEGTAYGAPGTTGPGGVPFTGANALSYFQNHVRHEIGHAVGGSPIGTMSESGNDFANAYGGWTPSSRSAFLGAMWSPAAAPSAGWPSLDFGGGAVQVNDTQVRDWLMGLVESGSEVAGPIKNGTKTMRQKIAVIVGSMWGGQRLTNYVNSTPGNSPAAVQDGAFQFPGFTPPSPVHIFATREGNQFMTYSKAAHDALHVTTGWYSLSSHAEMFAEMYTRKYSGGGTPPAVNGKDPAAWFAEAERQEDPRFGEPMDTSTPMPGAPAQAAG